MRELKSDELAQLVSIAGWARGAGAVAALVSQNYSPADAELLRQPGLLGLFVTHLAQGESNVRQQPPFAAMSIAFERIQQVVSRTDGEISRKDVKEIGATSDDLLKAIASRK